MADTITISLSDQDKSDLKMNIDWSPSKIFRSAMKLQRAREEFMDIYDIWDYRLKMSELFSKIQTLQREIERRNERIESLQDVLAQKELTLGRLRKTGEAADGHPSTIAEAERCA